MVALTVHADVRALVKAARVTFLTAAITVGLHRSLASLSEASNVRFYMLDHSLVGMQLGRYGDLVVARNCHHFGLSHFV